MSVNVILPSALRPLAGNAAVVVVQGNTVEAALRSLAAVNADLPGRLLDEQGRLKPYVHAFVEGQDITAAAGLATALRDGAELLLVQAIAGG